MWFDYEEDMVALKRGKDKSIPLDRFIERLLNYLRCGLVDVKLLPISPTRCPS